MIDLILIFDGRSGILLKEKSMQPLRGEPDLLAGFFHATKLCLGEFFPRELSEGFTQELKTKIIRVTPVPRTNANLIIMADKSDKKLLKNFSLEIVELLSYFRYRFIIFDGCVDVFNVFDKHINRIIEDANYTLDIENFIKQPINSKSVIEFMQK